jgi:hypothetical protein
MARCQLHFVAIAGLLKVPGMIFIWRREASSQEKALLVAVRIMMRIRQ